LAGFLETIRSRRGRNDFVLKKIFNQKLIEGKNMKTMKMIYPLAFALAIVLAAAGCKHQPLGITPMKPGPTPPPTEWVPPTLQDTNPPGTQINFDTNAASSGLVAANPLSFGGMIEDTNALASYTAHFKYDSAAVQKNEKSNLAAVAAALAADASTKLLIEGNCDERGTEEYNRALGERRALALREALAKIGVDPSRVRTISYGKDKPADTGHDEAAWAKNRCGDFILLHPNPNPSAVVPQS
jgi:peptidoglycan-associated lipoprotein